jgi:uncharacterized membrane protein
VDRSHMMLAFLIGAVAGLRSMTAPAIVAWAAHRDWLNLHRTSLAFMGATAAVVIFTVLAVIELVADKLPTTPSRLGLAGLTARVITGALCGASVAAAAAQPVQLGAALGVGGGIAGAFVGYGVRSRLVRRLKVPDWVIALVEDAVAIGGGLSIVWPS